MKKNKIIFICAILIIVAIIIGIVIFNVICNKNVNNNIVIAKWTYDANSNNAIIENISLKDIANGEIKPGSKGCFDIEIDGTNAGTGLAYAITIANIKDRPEKLKLYTDSAYSTELFLNGNSGVLTGSVSKEEAAEIYRKTIYWKWDEEENNNNVDASQMNFDIIMIVVANNATVEETNEE